MIGLSLSDCVRDIANGYAPVEQVMLVVTGTRSHLCGIDYIVAQYRQRFWADKPAECEAICRKLFADGKVFEPRNYGADVVSIGGRGHWVSTRAYTLVGTGHYKHFQFRLRHSPVAIPISAIGSLGG